MILLYREAAKVSAIINSIASLDYPKNKLDAKLVIEEDDSQTIHAIKLIELSSDYIQVVIVPFLHPLTKLKACNYAIQFTLGEYTVIYDAEDKPEIKQLLQAVKTFYFLPKEYACLQAELKIMPKTYDLLGFLLKIEYNIWFGYHFKWLI